MSHELSISEIFTSIQGETSRAGLPCTFVRLFGCNLNCSWCDTPYARQGEGAPMTVDDVLWQVEAAGVSLVCVTGGEPLLQGEAVAVLMGRLLEADHNVLLETNGTYDLSVVPPGVVSIVDVKCPASGESGRTLPGNLPLLRRRDEVKFVMADRADFDWAVSFVSEHDLADGPQILFAPVAGRLPPRELAEWILESGLEVRLQLQLHKIIWPERDHGV
jgi:7-carboxy-7-deazaguanine synthase